MHKAWGVLLVHIPIKFGNNYPNKRISRSSLVVINIAGLCLNIFIDSQPKKHEMIELLY